MSHYDDIESGYYKREDYLDRHPEQEIGCCECGGEVVLTGTDVYGADADGRRGVPLRVYTCTACGSEQEVYG